MLAPASPHDSPPPLRPHRRRAPRRARPPVVALLLLLATQARTARAEDRPAAVTQSRELVVLDVRAVGTVDPQTVAGLSSYVAAEASKHASRVISQADVATMIGLERQKQLLGCDDATCLTEIGGALGVQHVLTSEVSRFGGEWLLSVTLLDTRQAQASTRALRRATNERDLLALVPAAVDEALAPLARPSHRTLGLVLAGAGLALALGGGGLHYASLEAWDRAKQLGLEGRDYKAFTDARDRSDSEMLGARILYGAGAAALATGLWFFFTSPSAATAVSAAPLERGGAMLVATGRF